MVVVLTVVAPVSAGQDKRVVSQGLEGGRSGWIVRDRRGWYHVVVRREQIWMWHSGNVRCAAEKVRGWRGPECEVLGKFGFDSTGGV